LLKSADNLSAGAQLINADDANTLFDYRISAGYEFKIKSLSLQLSLEFLSGYE